MDKPEHGPLAREPARTASRSRRWCAGAGLVSVLGVWQMAIRPRTLLLSVSPVLAATFWAWHEVGRVRAGVVPLALGGAIAIQIGTNLLNDAADAARGVDTAERTGPPRVVALGLLDGTQIRFAAFLFFALAVLSGLGLVAIGGWPIAVLGLVSILSGALYSSGPRPISFMPFGELFVLVFFGVAAVAGTYFLHTGGLSNSTLMLGAAFGMPAAAVLLVNNHRDRASDARAGRRTLAILIGVGGAQLAYGVLMLAAVPLLAFGAGVACPAGLVVLVPLAMVHGLMTWRMAKTPVSAALNGLIGGTAASQLLMLAALVALTLICTG